MVSSVKNCPPKITATLTEDKKEKQSNLLLFHLSLLLSGITSDTSYQTVGPWHSIFCLSDRPQSQCVSLYPKNRSPDILSPYTIKEMGGTFLQAMADRSSLIGSIPCRVYESVIIVSQKWRSLLSRSSMM